MNGTLYVRRISLNLLRDLTGNQCSDLSRGLDSESLLDLVRNNSKDHVQKDSQLSPKREIALSAVPRYWELELMLLPSIKYDFTILRRVIMTLILLKTIHTLHNKNRKNNYYRRFTYIFYPIICWLVINTF